MAKLTKFETMQARLNELAQRYEIALKNDDTNALNSMKEEYLELRKLLYSHKVHFKNVKNTDLNLAIANTTDMDQLTKLYIKKNQKRLYSKNRAYVSMVEKAGSLEDYIKNNNKKSFNFVKRNFKKVVVFGALATALTVSMVSCNKKNKTNGQDKTNIEQTFDNKEDNNSNELNKLDAKEETKQIVKESSKAKLNPLDKEAKEDKKAKEEEKFITNEFEKKQKEESLDPHVNDDKKQTITTTVIEKEEEAKEPTAKDYDFNNKNNDDKTSKEEKVIIEEHEEPTPQDYDFTDIDGEDYKETTPFVPVKPSTQDNADEKVTIIEIEENIDPYDGTYIEEETTKQEIITPEEKVTIVEVEESQEIIDYENMPIVEDEPAIGLVYRR